MTDFRRLLPPSIADKRARATMNAWEELRRALPLERLLVYRLEALPEEALSLLAWQFRLLDGGWNMTETPAERRALIRRALELYRRRGTPWAVRQAIRSLGYADAEVIEGQPIALYDGQRNHSAAETYGGGTRWALFRVLLDLGETKGVTADSIVALTRLIGAWKNARSHLTDIGFRALVEDVLEVREAARIDVAYSGEDILSWGRRYDGSIDHDNGTRHLHDGALGFDGADDYSGWGETAALYDARRDSLSAVAAVQQADAMAVQPRHDGRYRHIAITYGAGNPSVADEGMPMRVTRHVRHDGRWRHSGDLHDGAARYDGQSPYFAGAYHQGPVHSHSTVY